MNQHIVLLAGDGIGPEIVAEAEKVLTQINEQFSLGLSWNHELLGGAAIDAHGVPLPDVTLDAARKADAILLGAVGGPKWDAIERSIRPERGLLKIRAELNLFANLRPALLYPQLAAASSLKPEIVSGLDLLIVRELTGGIYFGQPRGIRILENAEYPDVALSHMYVDNAAMQLVRAPKQFDVIVTGNLFGDILSDQAAMLTGSIGMLPSASLDQQKKGMYEPCHGSAPDIAGQGIANPLATILSVAMMLRYSLNAPLAAEAIEAAVGRVLDQGLRTADIFSEGTTRVGTKAMGDAVVAALAG